MSSNKSSQSGKKAVAASSTPAAPSKTASKKTTEKTAPVEKTAPAPVEKKEKAPRAKKEKTPAAPVDKHVAETSTDENANPDTPAAESTPAAAENADVVNIEKQIDELISRKESERQRIKEEIKMLHAMKKAYNKQQRDMRKKKNRRDAPRVGGAPRNPSGFARSSRITDELCDFLGLDHGSSIARTDVTKKVIEYIKAHSLEKGGNRRNIEPDAALEKLVGTAEERRNTMENRKKIKPRTAVTDELSYFNLQVHLNKHFMSEAEDKQESNVEAAAPVATA
jgi:upstream activation factor subunit UAF30